ncbi:MAG TPA: HlyD family efflux transporter periplasmic adaptor subunit [Gemmataceae bacterium]|nr:HlyD family efflux transporter periplasmic adaptor subunit [Gemmataceae bacterium]
MVKWLQVFLGLLLTLPLAGSEAFQAPEQAKKSKGKAEGPVIKVEKGTFKIDITLKGTFEAEQLSEVALSPKAWAPPAMAAPLTVQKAVEHGAVVKKGDVLVQLDLEKIDQAIKDAREERKLAEVAIHQAEDELPVQEKSTPVELAATQRAKKTADEDLDKFLKVDRALAEETSRRSVEDAEHYLQSAQEELKQLQKMYRDKDLTEETEEFILKRQRHQVRMAEFHVKTARIHNEEALKLEIPRKELTLRETSSKQELAWEKARNGLPLALNQKRLALEKMRYDFAKSTERLANLEKDRETLTVRSPADGIVYYGKAVHRHWTTASTAAAKLQRGGMLMPDEVFITIVNTRPIFVHAAVEEKDLQFLKPETKVRVTVAGYPDLKLPGQVNQISAIPQTPGNFEARVALELGDNAKAVMPGMACTVKVAAYRKNDALIVPAANVFSDDDGDSHYVYLPGESGKHHPVKVGKTHDGKTEIVEGLNEGEEILASKPAAK